jgi:hypothetical protein
LDAALADAVVAPAAGGGTPAKPRCPRPPARR